MLGHCATHGTLQEADEKGDGLASELQTGQASTAKLTSGTSTSVASAGSMPTLDRLELVKWHIDRYDRLRASTAARASVVLSAGAILSAGDALLLSQILGSTGRQLDRWLLLAFTAAAITTMCLVVLSVIRASNVLVTPRGSRMMLEHGSALPVGLIFNGTDTVRHVTTFAEFQSVVVSQGSADLLEAAELELWIGIHQHRYRYVRLRMAVRLLGYAAVTFLAILIAAMVVNLAARF